MFISIFEVLKHTLYSGCCAVLTETFKTYKLIKIYLSNWPFKMSALCFFDSGCIYILPLSNFLLTFHCILICRKISSQVIAAVSEESLFLQGAGNQHKHRTAKVLSSGWKWRTRFSCCKGTLLCLQSSKNAGASTPKSPQATQNASRKSLPGGGGGQNKEVGGGAQFKLGQLILRKIIKIVATRCHLLKLKCTKFDSDPQGEFTALPQTH